METICNFLTNNKDCLGLGLSLINTIAVIIIAHVQNKMQRKQTKMQEYEHYYDLYCFVNSIYYAVNGIKQNILNNIFSGLPTDSNIKQLRKYKGTIERLRAQLYATEMEFNLKVKTEFDFYIYDDALECAEKIYNRIITELTGNTIDIPNDIFCFNGIATDEERFNALLNNQSEKEKETLVKYFGELKKYQDEILNSGVLETLEKHCKID